jgi:polysaccharide biosynthesis protein PslH
MQRVLNIVPYPFLPGFSGGQKLIALFSEYLGKRCELHVAGTVSNDASLAKNYRFHPLFTDSKLRYADVFNYSRLKKIILQHRIDTIIIQHPYMGLFGWWLKKQLGVRLIVHTHNVEYERFRTIGKWWWPLLQQFERWVLQQADLVFCISAEDKLCMVENLGITAGKCVLVPYGIPQQRPPADKRTSKETVCRQLQLDPSLPFLFFNGLLDYKPNLEALETILNHILPLLQKQNFQYNMVVAGKRLPASYQELKPWKHLQVTYAGFVEDIDQYTAAADVLLNPVNTGGGVKTKMIEALGLNTTVVATQTGATGVVPEVCGQKLYVTGDHDWEAFAAAIRKSVQEQTVIPNAFYETYNWEHIAEKVARL